MFSGSCVLVPEIFLLPAFILRGIACCVTHLYFLNFIQQSQNSKVKRQNPSLRTFEFLLFAFELF